MAAKKSNKTEHVLKLITKNDEAAKGEDLFAIGGDLPETGSPAVTKEKLQEPDPVRREPAAAVTEVLKESPKESPKEPPKEAPKESPMLRAFREQESAGNIGSAVLEQNDDLVNIAEILAREKLALVMERMKVCTCRTCTNDVLALALNSLPTKYVTTDAGKQYFQLDVYKKQYETDILAAITKACVRVKASPRH